MNSLGKNGRFGNQLFQYAGLVGIAKNRGLDHCIPDHSNVSTFEDEMGRSIHHKLQKYFKLSYLNGRFGIVEGDLVELHQHHFCKELFDECPDNVTLHGHFESYNYFENAEDELRSDFQFKDDLKEVCDNFHIQNSLETPVSIVVRRGDFLKYPDCHPVCSNDYYKECIAQFGLDRQYLIVSDDIEWCKKQEIFFGNNFYFVDKYPDNIDKTGYDFCVSSLCQDFIISNSTFAWWISWMGEKKEKKVYMPDPWFGSTYGDWITDGFYPDYSIKILRNI